MSKVTSISQFVNRKKDISQLNFSNRKSIDIDEKYVVDFS